MRVTTRWQWFPVGLWWLAAGVFLLSPVASAAAALRQTASGWELVGINTFTEGYGGRFGDTGGGVLMEPYLDWIFGTTGIPEPGCAMLWAFSVALVMWRRGRTRTRGGDR